LSPAADLTPGWRSSHETQAALDGCEGF